MRKIGVFLGSIVLFLCLNESVQADRVWFPLTRLTGTTADGVLQLSNPDDTPRQVAVWLFTENYWMESNQIVLTVAPHAVLEKALPSLLQGMPIIPTGQSAFLVADDPAGTLVTLLLPAYPTPSGANKEDFGHETANKGQPNMLAGPFPVIPACLMTQSWAFYRLNNSEPSTMLLLGNPSSQTLAVQLTVSGNSGQLLAATSVHLPACSIRRGSCTTC